MWNSPSKLLLFFHLPKCASVSGKKKSVLSDETSIAGIKPGGYPHPEEPSSELRVFRLGGRSCFFIYLRFKGSQESGDWISQGHPKG